MVKKAVVLGTERKERAGNSVHVEKAEISFRENRRHYESLLELEMAVGSMECGRHTLFLVFLLHAELVERRSDIPRGPGLPFKVHRTFS